MNLHALLQKRLAQRGPVRVGLIGAGKFGSMFLAQVPTTPGIEVAAVADVAPGRARDACRRVGWTEGRLRATCFAGDALALLDRGDIEVVVEATGHAAAGIAHARRAIANRKHVVMVNVEADVLAGVALAREAARAGVVYTLAYGDQPALVCEMVDWARACGFAVLAAGKGTKYLPAYHASTPETVWGHYGVTPEQARRADRRPPRRRAAALRAPAQQRPVEAAPGATTPGPLSAAALGRADGPADAGRDPPKPTICVRCRSGSPTTTGPCRWRPSATAPRPCPGRCPNWCAGCCGR
jgi:hypothetical protein